MSYSKVSDEALEWKQQRLIDCNHSVDDINHNSSVTIHEIDKN